MVFSNPDRPFCRLSAAITGTISTLAFRSEKKRSANSATFEDFSHIDDEVAGALAVLRIEIGGGGKRTARITPGSLPASAPRRLRGKLALGWRDASAVPPRLSSAENSRRSLDFIRRRQVPDGECAAPRPAARLSLPKSTLRSSICRLRWINPPARREPSGNINSARARFQGSGHPASSQRWLGSSGISRMSMPRAGSSSASSIAWANSAPTGMAPASPTPLTPSSL